MLLAALVLRKLRCEVVRYTVQYYYIVLYGPLSLCHCQQAAVEAAASPHWEIRNAASLCFVALVHRMLGFKNVIQKDVARHAVTASEFFHR